MSYINSRLTLTLKLGLGLVVGHYGADRPLVSIRGDTSVRLHPGAITLLLCRVIRDVLALMFGDT